MLIHEQQRLEREMWEPSIRERLQGGVQIPSGIRPSGSSWSPPAVLTHSSSSQGNGRKPKGEGMQGDVVWVLGLTGCGSQQCQVSEGLPRTLTVCLLHSLPWIAGQYGSLFKLGCGDLDLVQGTSCLCLPSQHPWGFVTWVMPVVLLLSCS